MIQESNLRATGQNLRDRRVQRTQGLLKDALRDLLTKKPIDEIVVVEITEAANLNRATFYDHFADKYDLLNALIAADFDALLQRRNVSFDGTCASGLAAIVLAVGDYLEQIHSDKPACARHAPSEPLIDQAIMLAVERVVRSGLEARAVSVQVPVDVLAAMVTGGIYSSVKRWLSERGWRVEEGPLLRLTPHVASMLGKLDGETAKSEEDGRAAR